MDRLSRPYQDELLKALTDPEIVSNTTPISNFLHLNSIQILRHMFKDIHIPPAVKQEIETAFSGNSLI